MFNTLYLLNYNNYYNREFKKFDTISGYLQLPYYITTIPSANFNPNDHIQTQIILNLEDNMEGNYLIVTDDRNQIVSRWFIIESVRIRSGQYKLSLYRDTIADYYDVVINSPCFIEKALVPEVDPAIYNPEDITVNRIKTSETPIKDSTGVSWIVAYLNRSTESFKGGAAVAGSVDIIAPARQGWEYSAYIDGATPVISAITNTTFKMSFYNSRGYDKYYLTVDLSRYDQNAAIQSAYSKEDVRGPKAKFAISELAELSGEEFNQQFADTYPILFNEIPTALNFQPSDLSFLNSFLGLNGHTIKFDGDPLKYRIQVNTKKSTYTTPKMGDDQANSDILLGVIRNLWGDSDLGYDGGSSPPYYTVTFEYDEHSLTLIPEGKADTSGYNIPANREKLIDAPYDMICAPYETIQVKKGNTTYTSYQDTILSTFTDLALKNTGAAGSVYDIQRVPYCPINALTSIDGVLQADAWGDSSKYFEITDNNQNVTGVIFGCNVSNFQKTIPLEEPIEVKNIKIQSQCDMYRICSPNYNGIFEFDPMMNKGLNGFNIYCTYKPYSPYIQVAPQFDGLYGTNFNDSRGLICGGEWSMPMMSDAWATYERQNMNYQNTFARSIENMKVQHKAQRTQETANLIVGTMQAALTGVGAGLMMGGGIGAAIGGAVGGIGSAAAGITDRKINNMLRNEAIDYAQDQFGYQLGNIQALPASLARTSAFTINNKIFPFLEYYTCTETEKKAFANKIIHNGMSIMRIGTIGEFISNTWEYNGEPARNYIKGQIIKCEGLEGDQHLANTISNELNQGIYFGGQK